MNVLKRAAGLETEFAKWLRNQDHSVEVRPVHNHAHAVVRIDQSPGYYERKSNSEMVLQLSLTDTSKIRLDHGDLAFYGRNSAQLAISPASEECTYDAPVRSSFLCLTLPSQAIQPLALEAGLKRATDFGGLHHRVFDDPVVATLVRRLWAEASLGDRAAQLFADAALQTVILSLLRLEHGCITSPAIGGGLSARAFARVVERVEEGLLDDLKVAELAAEADLSPWHFSRCFKTKTGMTPATFITMRKIERAKALLADTTEPITVIAHACGFSSSQHMATVFRRVLGTTPTDYRRARLS